MTRLRLWFWLVVQYVADRHVVFHHELYWHAKRKVRRLRALRDRELDT